MPNWLHTASALVTTISGALLTFDWTSVIGNPHTVGVVLMVLGALKSVGGTFAPSVPASSAKPSA